MGEARRLRVPAALQEPFRAALVAAVDVWIAREGLIYIVLFGSVARRQAGPLADIDVRLVAEGRPRRLADRRRPFLDAWQWVRAARRLPHVEWNLVVKTPGEARVRSPLSRDVVEDGILILDRQGLVEAILRPEARLPFRRGRGDMPSSRMGRLYVEEARDRLALVRLALERGLWAATVRAAQECVELFLKGARRFATISTNQTAGSVYACRRGKEDAQKAREYKVICSRGQGGHKIDDPRDLTTRRIHGQTRCRDDRRGTSRSGWIRGGKENCRTSR